jgi:hypothetical protein
MLNLTPRLDRTVFSRTKDLADIEFLTNRGKRI